MLEHIRVFAVQWWEKSWGWLEFRVTLRLYSNESGETPKVPVRYFWHSNRLELTLQSTRVPLNTVSKNPHPKTGDLVARVRKWLKLGGGFQLECFIVYKLLRVFEWLEKQFLKPDLVSFWHVPISSAWNFQISQDNSIIYTRTIFAYNQLTSALVVKISKEFEMAILVQEKILLSFLAETSKILLLTSTCGIWRIWSQILNHGAVSMLG